MGLVNCNNCGKLFDKKKSNLCPICEELEAKKIKKINNYLNSLEKNAKYSLTVTTISTATGIKIQEIEKLYRFNKLKELTGLIDLECKLCKDKFKPTIHSGAFCKKCTKKVEKMVKDLKSPESNQNIEIQENNLLIQNITTEKKKNSHKKAGCI